MASQEVKLLGGWPSPFVLRARVALNIKSVSYEFVPENVLVNKSDLILKHNPVYKKIPVLIHGENSVCESLIIVQYVDEAWASAPSIMPADPYDRSVARFWTAYIDDKLFPTIRGLLQEEEVDSRKEAVEEATQGMALLEDVFVKCSKGRNFFGGEKIGYLDIALGCLLAWLRVIQIKANVSFIDESTTPNLFRWAQHFSADAAVKDVLPATERLLAFVDYRAAKTNGQ